MLDLRPVEEKSPLDAKLRAFISLNPPPEWREGLDDWLRIERRRFSPEFARWTSPEKVHITLRFFGMITQAQVLELTELLQPIASATSPFELQVGQLGCFPRVERARIFWLGLGGAIQSLAELESKLRAATARFGEAPEDRAFKAHLTVARINRPNATDRKTLRDLVEAQGVPKLTPWRVSELHLTRSQLGKGGSTYTTLASFKLGS